MEPWQSYDSAGAAYDRVAVQAYFLGPARDLVAALELSPGHVVLDAGTGTAAVGRVAAPLVEPTGAVFGVDASPGMLSLARRHGVRFLVAGTVSDLPFATERFDRVVASFVVSHLRSYQAGLAEFLRVLRRGGRLAITAWQTIDDDYRQFWRSVAASFVSADALERATEQSIPWEEHFAEQANLVGALSDVGLRDLVVSTRHYTMQVPITDFLDLRETAMQARYMRAQLSPGEWERFRNVVAQAFHSRFADPLNEVRDAHIAMGTKA